LIQFATAVAAKLPQRLQRMRGPKVAASSGPLMAAPPAGHEHGLRRAGAFVI
jgi:hypothetical protein